MGPRRRPRPRPEVLGLLLLTGAWCAGSAGGATSGGAGVALTPPLGWRSWNAYHLTVTQSAVSAAGVALAAARNGSGRLDAGGAYSFRALGFVDVGLDDGWQACGKGVEGKFRGPDGLPLVNRARFPNLHKMVAGLHALRLRAGFYLNNCECREVPDGAQGNTTDYVRNFPGDSAYRGDVQVARSAGFDSLKIDNCGPWINMDTYFNLSRPMMVEVNPWAPATYDRYKPSNRGPGYGVPNATWCPMHMFRVSKDLKPTWESVWWNLQAMRSFSDVSRPGCWAYADMLYLGKLASAMEDRAHFSAWCITSSPLILGHKASDERVNQYVFGLVNNPLALAVNQQWAGHAGAMVAEVRPGVQLWAKPLLGGDVAVMLINGGTRRIQASVDVDAARLRFSRPPARKYFVIDVWGGASSTRENKFPVSLFAHEAVFYVVKGGGTFAPSRAPTARPTTRTPTTARPSTSKPTRPTRS